MIYFDWSHVEMTGYKYSQVQSQRGPIHQNIAYITTGTVAEYQSGVELIKKHHIPRHNGQAMGCLSWVFLRDWPCYNGTTVYVLLGTRSRKRFLFRFPSAKNVKWSALLTLCEGNPQITIGRPQQMANNAESISMTWRVHDLFWLGSCRDDRLHIQSSAVTTRFNISNIAYITTGTEAEYQSGVELINNTIYLAITGKLWDAFREYFWEIDRVITAPHCTSF